MLYGKKGMMSQPGDWNEEKTFGEFRRKVKSAEVLSASMENLLKSLHFTGQVIVIMQNGRVLKSGYEESLFRHSQGGGGIDENAQEI